MEVVAVIYFLKRLTKRGKLESQIIEAIEDLTVRQSRSEFTTTNIKVNRDNCGSVRDKNTTLIIVSVQVLIDSEWRYVFKAEHFMKPWKVIHLDHGAWCDELLRLDSALLWPQQPPYLAL